jgi:CRP-like cAMP-binding protein
MEVSVGSLPVPNVSIQFQAIAALVQRMARRDDVSDEEKAAIASAAGEDRTYAAGTDLVLEGAEPTRSTLLVSGFATRYRVVEDGGRQITSIHVAGDFVDLHGFLLRKMDHSVGALSDCRVIAFPHEGLRRITERYPHLTRLLWLMTLLDAAMNREWIVGMGRLSAVERMAHLLCELKIRLDAVGLAERDRFRFPATQVALADALGLSTVHVSRVLKELRDQGLADWDGEDVRIGDWDGLLRLAQFDDTYLHLEHLRR